MFLIVNNNCIYIFNSRLFLNYRSIKKNYKLDFKFKIKLLNILIMKKKNYNSKNAHHIL